MLEENCFPTLFFFLIHKYKIAEDLKISLHIMRKKIGKMI